MQTQPEGRERGKEGTNTGILTPTIHTCPLSCNYEKVENCKKVVLVFQTFGLLSRKVGYCEKVGRNMATEIAKQASFFLFIHHLFSYRTYLEPWILTIWFTWSYSEVFMLRVLFSKHSYTLRCPYFCSRPCAGEAMYLSSRGILCRRSNMPQ